MRASRLPRLGLLVVLAASCASPAPVITPPPAPRPPRIVLPNPGRPYTTADMLAVLVAPSRSNVPAELVRPEVAEALAAAVWTYDGRPYGVVGADGFCGPRTCQVSVLGMPDGSDDARNDHYIFDMDPHTFELSRVYIGLGAFPIDVDPQLDAITRAALPRERLESMHFDRATWLPPPEFGRFEVIYGDGGLEGSRGLRVILDARVGSVILVEEFTR